MALAVIRNISSARALSTQRDIEDFEQEIVDQFALSMAASNLTDSHIGNARAAIFEFARALNGPLWTASCDDADRFLSGLRLEGRAPARGRARPACWPTSTTS